MEAATLVEAHHISFLRLRKTRKRWGNTKVQFQPPLSSTTVSILARYRQASNGFCCRCQSISVAMDASRAGGKDLILRMLVGTNPEGDPRCCWAPPQDSASVACSCARAPAPIAPTPRPAPRGTLQK